MKDKKKEYKSMTKSGAMPSSVIGLKSSIQKAKMRGIDPKKGISLKGAGLSTVSALEETKKTRSAAKKEMEEARSAAVTKKYKELAGKMRKEPITEKGANATSYINDDQRVDWKFKPRHSMDTPERQWEEVVKKKYQKR